MEPKIVVVIICVLDTYTPLTLPIWLIRPYYSVLLALERLKYIIVRSSAGINTMKKYSRSKGFTLVEIMIVVVIIGLLAAMAIPAFQKVRASSQDKAVLNNARQLSGAADQYYLEYGVNSVASSMLIGVDSYVKNLQTAASEVYPTTYTQGLTITVTNVGNARTVTYAH
jgi:type IV pilus assembly protein PilA